MATDISGEGVLEGRGRARGVVGHELWRGSRGLWGW